MRWPIPSGCAGNPQPGADVDASIRNFAAVVDAIAGQGGRRAQAGRRRAFRRLPK